MGISVGNRLEFHNQLSVLLNRLIIDYIIGFFTFHIPWLSLRLFEQCGQIIHTSIYQSQSWPLPCHIF